MEEFVIGLSGELLQKETLANIKRDLALIAEQIDHEMGGGFQIQGDLDYSKTAKNIQDSLNDIASNLTFKIKDDGLSEITKALQEIGKAMAQSLSNSNDGFVQQVHNRIAALEDFKSEANQTLKIVNRMTD